MVFRTDAALPVPVVGVDTPIVETTALSYSDFGGAVAPQIGSKYFYWIAAKNANGTTVISKPNDGYLSRKGPANRHRQQRHL